MTLSPLDNAVDLQLSEAVLGSGLAVRVDHRPERRGGYIALGVDFGSIDRGAAGRSVPAGTAHFLEHELFEDDAGDVSDRFAALGASANAFTGFSGTTFIASTTRDMHAAIELLLKFVQSPSFDNERIARERSVIVQEIRMYDDDPDWRVFEGLMGCLFEHHPVREQIAGSEQSIADIDAALLESVHGQHYHPQALCLAVSGPIDPDDVHALAEADQLARPARDADRCVRAAVSEPRGRVHERYVVELPIARPRLLLGIKETVLGGDQEQLARRQLVTRMGLDLVLGRSSSAFETLYEAGLIDESFGVSHSAESDFGFTTMGGETDQPEELAARLKDLLGKALKQGLDRRAHERVHHKVYGSLMRALESPEAVAHGLISSRFRGVEPFRVAAMVADVSLDEVHARLVEHVCDEAFAHAVARPSSS